MKYLFSLWLLIPITALANLAAQAQGTRCWETPSGWVCQQTQQTNPSNGQ